MTDEIRGPWFSERRNPLRREQSPEEEGQALRDALHTAVGEIRRTLGDCPASKRSGDGFQAVLRRIAEHDVLATVRLGRLDVPTDQILTPPTAGDWVSRSLLYGVVRDLAIDEGLQDIFLIEGGVNEALQSMSATRGAGPELDALGTSLVWGRHVAEPLARVDELWVSAWRAVLRHDRGATDILRQLEIALPAIGAAPEPQPTGTYLEVLRRRVEDGDIAWDATEPALWHEELSGADASAIAVNPWLTLPGLLPTPEPAENGRHFAVQLDGSALASLWAWVQQMWERLYGCVANTLQPTATALYWEAVARILAALAPRSTSDSRTAGVEGETTSEAMELPYGDMAFGTRPEDADDPVEDVPAGLFETKDEVPLDAFDFQSWLLEPPPVAPPFEAVPPAEEPLTWEPPEVGPPVVEPRAAEPFADEPFAAEPFGVEPSAVIPPRPQAPPPPLVPPRPEKPPVVFAHPEPLPEPRPLVESEALPEPELVPEFASEPELLPEPEPASAAVPEPVSAREPEYEPSALPAPVPPAPDEALALAVARLDSLPGDAAKPLPRPVPRKAPVPTARALPVPADGLDPHVRSVISTMARTLTPVSQVNRRKPAKQS